MGAELRCRAIGATAGRLSAYLLERCGSEAAQYARTLRTAAAAWACLQASRFSSRRRLGLFRKVWDALLRCRAGDGDPFVRAPVAQHTKQPLTELNSEAASAGTRRCRTNQTGAAVADRLSSSVWRLSVLKNERELRDLPECSEALSASSYTFKASTALQ